MKNLEKLQTLFDLHKLPTPHTYERIGGLTNRNYKVLSDDATFVLRVAGKGTDKLINRMDEGLIVSTIKDLNIDAPLVLFDAPTGVKICEYIPGAQTLSAALLREPDNLKKAAQILHTLHTKTPTIPIHFDVFEMIDRYEKTLRELDGFFPATYAQTRQDVKDLYQSHQKSQSAKVLCHNDPLPENFILSITGEMKLVDWEYGGMNSPFWDLADVSIESDYTPEHDHQLLMEYKGQTPSQEDLVEFELNKIYIDLLWCLWGYIREELKEDDETEDFLTYGNDRYQRLEKNLEHFLLEIE